MIVFAIQWQDKGEPWGWETWLQFADEGVAREVYDRTVKRTMERAEGGRWDAVARAEEFVLSGLRLVSLPVLDRLPPEENDPLAGDEPPGVVVLLP